MTSRPLQVQAEEASAQEHVSSLAMELDVLGRERAEASAAHADVSITLLEARKHLSHLQACRLSGLQHMVAK